MRAPPPTLPMKVISPSPGLSCASCSAFARLEVLARLRDALLGRPFAALPSGAPRGLAVSPSRRPAAALGSVAVLALGSMSMRITWPSKYLGFDSE